MQTRKQEENLVIALSKVNVLILAMVELYIHIWMIISDYLVIHQEDQNDGRISTARIDLQLKDVWNVY